MHHWVHRGITHFEPCLMLDDAAHAAMECRQQLSVCFNTILIVLHSLSTCRSVTLLDSILAHDVEDAVPDGIPIPPASGEPSHSQSSKESTLRIPTGPCLHHKCVFKHAYSCANCSVSMQLNSVFKLHQ